MKKIFVKKFVEIALITLLFLGCVSTPSQTTTPPATTSPSTTASPAEFEITDLRVIPENPQVGDTLTILVDVQNKGDSSGSYTILVTIGSKSKTQNIELEGKSSKTVQFQETADTEGNIEIKAGNLTKTIAVAPLTTPSPTTTAPATEPPQDSKKIYEPDLPVGSVLTYYFTVRGAEWGSTVRKSKGDEEDRSTWFVWGNLLCVPPDNIDNVVHRGDYTYYYKGNTLEKIYMEGAWWCCKYYYIKYTYSPPLPSVYSLVKGVSKNDQGQFLTEFFCNSVIKYSGRGTYKREIYVESFENVTAGRKEYECAKVKFTMTYEVRYNTGEPWRLYKWVEDGYIWYSEIGMIKAEYTVKTYFSDELKKTDEVSIILNSATMP